MRIQTRITAVFAAVLSASMLTGCLSDADGDNPAHEDAAIPLIAGAAQSAQEREEEAAEKRKRRAFRRRLQEQQEGEGGGDGGGGGGGHSH